MPGVWGQRPQEFNTDRRTPPLGRGSRGSDASGDGCKSPDIVPSQRGPPPVRRSRVAGVAPFALWAKSARRAAEFRRAARPQQAMQARPPRAQPRHGAPGSPCRGEHKRGARRSRAGARANQLVILVAFGAVLEGLLYLLGLIAIHRKNIAVQLGVQLKVQDAVLLAAGIVGIAPLLQGIDRLLG